MRSNDQVIEAITVHITGAADGGAAIVVRVHTGDGDAGGPEIREIDRRR